MGVVVQIVVRQISGLGNQLFQYAAGKYFARHYGANMKLALDPRGANANGYPRPFLLNQYSITSPYHPLTTTERIMLSPKPRLRLAGSALRHFSRTQIVVEAVDQRYKFLSDFEFEKDTQTIYLVGYWQAYRFADEVEDELRSELTLQMSPSGEDLRVLGQIQAAEHPISLHMRRGDYVLGTDGFATLSVDYYNCAIQYFKERVMNPKFFVFSDDIDFAKKSLPANEPIVFVHHNDSSTAHEDLRLMSSCRDHIIANSSFSWWGAWLNPRRDKTVYSPRYWHLHSNHSLSELLPAGWVLADNESELCNRQLSSE
ncbi:MAG: alpha-1,2-fucosyltransferase [Acidobacteria bacterium]|nr:alpha-1,2-fucosyltransferase [Acidobacteriota bacterium]